VGSHHALIQQNKTMTVHMYKVSLYDAQYTVRFTNLFMIRLLKV